MPDPTPLRPDVTLGPPSRRIRERTSLLVYRVADREEPPAALITVPAWRKFQPFWHPLIPDFRGQQDALVALYQGACRKGACLWASVIVDAETVAGLGITAVSAERGTGRPPIGKLPDYAEYYKPPKGGDE